MTLKVREDVPSLRSVRLVRELEETFRRGCERGDFRLVHYSVQRDHLHLIVEATGTEALGRGMKAIGARIARAVNRVFGRRGPVLADRYHSRALETPKEVRLALRYVLLNARKHARRVGRLATGWILRRPGAGSMDGGSSRRRTRPPWRPRGGGSPGRAGGSMVCWIREKCRA